jgi:hypothetical protein
LRHVLPEIRHAGGDLAIVGTGHPSSAKSFQQELELGDVCVFIDETRRAYDRVGFRRGIWTLLRPRAVGNYLRAFASGHRWKPKEGDALQQGGVIIVRPDGSIPFRYVSRASGDEPAVDALIAALRAAAAPKGEA